MAPARRHVAFLRAINVGGHTVKKETLSGLFEAIGLANATTFLASGNVIFDSSEDVSVLEGWLESALAGGLGYEVITFVRSLRQVAEIAAFEAFPQAVEEGAHSLSVAFVKEEPGAAARERLLALRDDNNDFFLHGREFYWLSRLSTRDSGLSGNILERALGPAPATLRNVRTVRRLAAKYGG